MDGVINCKANGNVAHQHSEKAHGYVKPAYNTEHNNNWRKVGHHTEKADAQPADEENHKKRDYDQGVNVTPRHTCNCIGYCPEKQGCHAGSGDFYIRVFFLKMLIDLIKKTAVSNGVFKRQLCHDTRLTELVVSKVFHVVRPAVFKKQEFLGDQLSVLGNGIEFFSVLIKRPVYFF